MLTLCLWAPLALAQPADHARLVLDPVQPASVAFERLRSYRQGELRLMGPAVTQAGTRLTVPQYLLLVDRNAAETLTARIRSTRGASAALGVIGALGFGSVMAGNLGQHMGDTPAARQSWRQVRTGGLLAGLVGLTGSLLASRAAQRLEHDFTVTQDPATTLFAIQHYNARLRDDLGVRLATQLPPLPADLDRRQPPPRAILRPR